MSGFWSTQVGLLSTRVGLLRMGWAYFQEKGFLKIMSEQYIHVPISWTDAGLIFANRTESSQICESFILQNEPQNISSSMHPELTLKYWFIICAGNCGVPIPPDNGTVVNSTGTLEGSVIYYQCNPGFIPLDVMSAVCTAVGSWSPDPANETCRELGMWGPEPEWGSLGH